LASSRNYQFIQPRIRNSSFIPLQLRYYIGYKLVTASSLIVSDPEILGGTPVFKGTRVPVRTLFEYLAGGLSLEYFLESFPSVAREQAAGVLRLSQQRIEQETAA